MLVISDIHKQRRDLVLTVRMSPGVIFISASGWSESGWESGLFVLATSRTCCGSHANSQSDRNPEAFCGSRSFETIPSGSPVAALALYDASTSIRMFPALTSRCNIP